MAIRGRRQPFPPIIKRGVVEQLAGASPVKVQRCYAVVPLRMPRRNPFPPIFKTLQTLPAAAVVSTRPKDFRIHLNEKVKDKRDWFHQQTVSTVLNPLLISGEIQMAGPGLFEFGYTPTTSTDWGNVLPDNLRDALDRLAAACKAAGFTP